MKIFRFITIIYEYIYKQVNCISYWRKKGMSIGERCIIASDSLKMNSEPYLISIGNHVRINSGVELITHDGGVWVLRDYLTDKDAPKIDLFDDISIGNNVHIGTNAIIMPGVRIGNNCIIGCSAVVTKNVPDNCVVAGIPAKIIESIDEYYEKNKLDFDYTKMMDLKDKKSYLIRKYRQE